ncbi:MAG: exodeoxyribonuclease VII small subunit [Pseudomonadota bacterium]|nr:exodeoxyribonuclease VII small subunit [Pseudomonadota bacterium]
MSDKNPIADFEQSMAQIDTIAREMESGQLTLEQSLAKFEHGMTLIKQCQGALDQAEQKIQMLFGDKLEPVADDTPEF